MEVSGIFLQGVGFAEFLYYGANESGYNVMVTELLGPNLEDLFNYCNRQFTLKTTLMLADQMLCRVEYMHGVNFLHRYELLLQACGRAKESDEVLECSSSFCELSTQTQQNNAKHLHLSTLCCLCISNRASDTLRKYCEKLHSKKIKS